MRTDHHGTLRSLVWTLLAAGLLAAAVVPLQARALGVAREQRSRASAELDAAREGRRDVHEDAVRAGAALAESRWRWAVEASDATSTERRIADHSRRRALEELALEGDRAELTATTDSLEGVRALLGLQQHVMEPLRRCLSGVRRANDALLRGDEAGAATALDTASGACLQVRQGSTPPAFPYDFPDPHVVRGSDGRWWAYATNSNAGTVQHISSDDLASWRVEGNALGPLPEWATPGATWAPAVVQHAGRWLLYYTVRERSSGLQCISVAHSGSPAGPFSDTSSGPVVCEREEGGSIDPDPVVDAGRLHLLWKTELDTRGRPAELRGAPVTDDGTTLTAPAVTLLRASERWEGRTIEGPAMVVGRGYHLLYSGGSWNTARYGVGAARCETVLGPCVKQSSTPVLASFGDVRGPGGISVFGTEGGHGVAYHAWQGDAVGYPATRFLHIGRLEADTGSVTVHP